MGTTGVTSGSSTSVSVSEIWSHGEVDAYAYVVSSENKSRVAREWKLGVRGMGALWARSKVGVVAEVVGS